MIDYQMFAYHKTSPNGMHSVPAYGSYSTPFRNTRSSSPFKGMPYTQQDLAVTVTV
jgi:hypothetical protein